jgi:hypothetical protein
VSGLKNISKFSRSAAVTCSLNLEGTSGDLGDLTVSTVSSFTSPSTFCLFSTAGSHSSVVTVGAVTAAAGSYSAVDICKFRF